MEDLIQEIILELKKQYDKTKEINTEEVFFSIAEKYTFETVDAYGSILGKIPNIGEFFIPNSYGQGDSWEEETLEFDFVILKQKEVIIVRYKNNDFSVDHVFFDVKINFDDFGGKRGYYLHKDLVRFRTTKEFYQNLKDENKYPKGEKDLSGPHFTVRF